MIKFLQKSFILLVVLCLISCRSTYMQVIEISQDSLEVQGDSIVYGNEDLKVYYNRCFSGDVLNITIQNETNKDIFLNKGLSCLVVNGKVVSDGILSTSDKNVAIDMSGVVCLPAKCFRTFSFGKLLHSRIMTGDLEKDYPEKSYIVADYSHGDSTLAFATNIIYGNSPNETSKNINNKFWLKRVINFRRKTGKESSSNQTVSPYFFYFYYGYKTDTQKGYGGY